MRTWVPWALAVALLASSHRDDVSDSGAFQARNRQTRAGDTVGHTSHISINHHGQSIKANDSTRSKARLSGRGDKDETNPNQEPKQRGVPEEHDLDRGLAAEMAGRFPDEGEKALVRHHEGNKIAADLSNTPDGLPDSIAKPLSGLWGRTDHGVAGKQKKRISKNMHRKIGKIKDKLKAMFADIAKDLEELAKVDPETLFTEGETYGGPMAAYFLKVDFENVTSSGGHHWYNFRVTPKKKCIEAFDKIFAAAKGWTKPISYNSWVVQKKFSDFDELAAQLEDDSPSFCANSFGHDEEHMGIFEAFASFMQDGGSAQDLMSAWIQRVLFSPSGVSLRTATDQFLEVHQHLGVKLKGISWAWFTKNWASYHDEQEKTMTRQVDSIKKGRYYGQYRDWSAGELHKGLALWVRSFRHWAV